MAKDFFEVVERILKSPNSRVVRVWNTVESDESRFFHTAYYSLVLEHGVVVYKVQDVMRLEYAAPSLKTREEIIAKEVQKAFELSELV